MTFLSEALPQSVYLLTLDWELGSNLHLVGGCPKMEDWFNTIKALESNDTFRGIRVSAVNQIEEGYVVFDLILEPAL